MDVVKPYLTEKKTDFKTNQYIPTEILEEKKVSEIMDIINNF